MSIPRIGHGFDVHRLDSGRKLIIGGIEIPHEKGLDGHSDADVLVHAIMDALLGAAGLPDIGRHFPPDDVRYRDANSIELLRQVKGFIEKVGLGKIINIDATIMAQRPKMVEYIPKMRVRIAEALEIGPECINVKATTTEKLGFVGREEGIAAEAVCLICDG